MIVLGISGPGANSSSALIKNGKLISLIEEERITRIKTAPHGLPFQSATLCLNEAGIDISKVDYIAWGWDCNKYQKILKKFNSKLNKKSKNYKYNLLNTVLYDPKIIKKDVDYLKLNKGDILILAAFGGGFTWGSIYLKWAY